jgi:hypothetical protein
MSAHEISKCIEENVFRVPYVGQRASVWSSDSYEKWADTLFKIKSDPTIIPNIVIAMITDNLLDYQVIKPQYSIGDNDCANYSQCDKHHKQQMIIDGAQRCSSIYSFFNGSYVGTDNIVYSLTFNITQPPVYDESNSHFKLSKIVGKIMKLKNYIDFHWLLRELAKVVDGEKNIHELIETITRMCKPKNGVTASDMRPIITSNLLMIINGPFFNKESGLSVFKMAMESPRMSYYFELLNNRKGKTISKAGMMWIDLCRNIGNVDKVKEITNWFSSNDLEKEHIFRVYINSVLGPELHKEDISEKTFFVATRDSGVTILEYIDFIQDVHKIFVDNDLNFKSVWDSTYLAMNVMLGFWLNKNDILGFYRNAERYINRAKKLSDKEYETQKKALLSGKKDWFVTSRAY